MPPTKVVIALLVLGHVARADPDRPAFFDAGIVSRHFSSPAGNAIARTLVPVAPADQATSAIAADLRFGMAVFTFGFLGVETEIGQLDTEGSNLGGLYGVAGTRARFGGLMLGAELAAGWRGTTHTSPSEPDHDEAVLEPRARAEVWLASQFTLGVAAGLTVAGTESWMMTAYLGVHSLDFAGQ